MQYPPQRPIYPPSEIYIAEQPQEYIPQSPMAIAVYVNRGQIIWRTALCVFCLLFMILDFAVLVGLSTFLSMPAGLLIFAPLFFTVMAVVVFIGWVSWSMFSMLLTHKPLLIINREGIVVSRVPMLSGYSISWGEIEAIFASRYLFYKYLCIAPKNPDQYLKTHFNAFVRLSRRFNAWFIGAPLCLPQIYLDRRLEEILQQISYLYANELGYYRVQIRS